MGHYSIYWRVQRNILHCMREENIASGPYALVYASFILLEIEIYIRKIFFPDQPTHILF